MPCIIAFIILGLMSIFSATHRQLAKEAFDCVFRRITLRPCNTGFREKIKAALVARLILKSPLLAKLAAKNFELLSWIFAILTLGSLFWVTRGMVNFYLYGSCRGLNDTGVCLLDMSGENNSVTSCGSQPAANHTPTMAGVDWSLFAQTNPQSSQQVIFIGCVNCNYSRQVYQSVFNLAKEYQANFIFAHYPVKAETDYLVSLFDCLNKESQAAFWLFLSQLFANDPQVNASSEAVLSQAESFGFNKQSLSECLQNSLTNGRQQYLLQEISQTNLYGTPLVFINSQAYIGPKPWRVYRHAIKAATK